MARQRLRDLRRIFAIAALALAVAIPAGVGAEGESWGRVKALLAP